MTSFPAVVFHACPEMHEPWLSCLAALPYLGLQTTERTKTLCQKARHLLLSTKARIKTDLKTVYSYIQDYSGN